MNMIKRHKNLILAIIIPFLWICLVSMITGIYFETNDDRLFSEIFSGAMTGTPEFRSYYIHPFLGLIITLFYRITTILPWYGLFLILFQWICHASFTYSVLSRYEKTRKKTAAFSLPAACSLLIVYYGICFTFVAHIQFTSTAALLAITGYVCLFLSLDMSSSDMSVSVGNDSAENDSVESDSFACFLSAMSWKSSPLPLFFILQLLSYLLRSDSMLMIQPYGMAILAALLLCRFIRAKSKETRRVLCRFFCKVLFSMILLILLGKTTHFLFHHGEGWTEYEKINQGVTEITDYSRIPDYTEVKSILEKYEVSEKQYQAFFQYAMIEPNLSGDCLLEVAEYARTMQPETSIGQVLSGIRESYFNPEYYSTGKLTLVLWFLTIMVVLLAGNYLSLLPLAGLFFSRTLIWGDLIYRGRTPFRVIYPLWVVEILLLMVIICLGLDGAHSPKSDTSSEVSLKSSNPAPGYSKRTQYTIILCQFIFCFLILGSLWILKKQYTTIKPQNQSDKIYNAGFADLIAYCDNHPENHYFLDAGTLLYYRGSAYTAKPFHPRNSLITGCWYSGAPVLYDRIAEYAPQDIDIYLVVSPDLIYQKEAVLAYFEEWRGTNAIYEDSFTVSNGGTYEVFCFPR